AERAGGDAGQLEGALRRGLLQGAGVAAQLVRVVGLGERVGGLGRGRARLARHQLLAEAVPLGPVGVHEAAGAVAVVALGPGADVGVAVDGGVRGAQRVLQGGDLVRPLVGRGRGGRLGRGAGRCRCHVASSASRWAWPISQAPTEASSWASAGSSTWAHSRARATAEASSAACRSAVDGGSSGTGSGEAAPFSPDSADPRSCPASPSAASPGSRARSAARCSSWWDRKGSSSPAGPSPASTAARYRATSRSLAVTAPRRIRSSWPTSLGYQRTPQPDAPAAAAAARAPSRAVRRVTAMPPERGSARREGPSPSTDSANLVLLLS